jgi:hypothetical protein
MPQSDVPPPGEGATTDNAASNVVPQFAYGYKAEVDQGMERFKSQIGTLACHEDVTLGAIINNHSLLASCYLDTLRALVGQELTCIALRKSLKAAGKKHLKLEQKLHVQSSGE